jgi:outer membrane lipoprotein-sorting protein
MTRCNYVANRLRAHIDGQLLPAERENVRLHLETCAACRAEYRRMAEVLPLLRAQPLDDTPPHFTANLQVRLASLRAARHPLPWWQRLGKSASHRLRSLRRRPGVAVAAGMLAVALLAASLFTSRQPGVAEIARRAEFSWARVRNYHCELVTHGVQRGKPSEFAQRTWFMKPGFYRFETNQYYRLVTIIDEQSVRHYIPGGDWEGQGPLVIVRPRTERGAELPFPFGITWPAGSNVTVDTLLDQLRTTQNAKVLGGETVRDQDCYKVQFTTPLPGGQPEDCTMWLSRDTALPLRILRRRDKDNETVTDAVNLQFNDELLPSSTFELKPPQGAFVIHGDVDPHVFALKGKTPRPAWFDRDPLLATVHQVVTNRERLPFTAMTPTHLPPGYRLVRVRRPLGRWLDIHWIAEQPGPAARVMRLTEQAEAVEDPAETRDGSAVNIGTALDPLYARVKQGSQPYPHCYVSWRDHGTLLTLCSAELSFEETLKVARSVRAAPAELPSLAPIFVGPPAPPPAHPVAAPPASDTPSAPVTGDGTPPASASDPPMMPETPEDDGAKPVNAPGR